MTNQNNLSNRLWWFIVGFSTAAVLAVCINSYQTSLRDYGLIRRGLKIYHPTTGQLVWKDEVTE